MLSSLKGFLLFSIEVILHITLISFSEKMPVKLMVMKQTILSLLLFPASASLLFLVNPAGSLGYPNKIMSEQIYVHVSGQAI